MKLYLDYNIIIKNVKVIGRIYLGYIFFGVLMFFRLGIFCKVIFLFKCVSFCVCGGGEILTFIGNR